MELDDVDRGILHMLQNDARNNSATVIADEVGVAPNTVRNRIERLEEHDVIDGYYPHINYERAGYQLHVVFVCSIPIADRHEFADAVLETHGVVRVNEILSGHENLAVEVVGEDSEDITSIAGRLEAIGCDITDEWFLRNTQAKPFNHFGSDATED